MNERGGLLFAKECREARVAAGVDASQLCILLRSRPRLWCGLAGVR